MQKRLAEDALGAAGRDVERQIKPVYDIAVPDLGLKELHIAPWIIVRILLLHTQSDNILQ